MLIEDNRNIPAELEFFARPDHLADVRRLVERLAAKTALSPDEVSDFLTAVDEAAANAIRHGSPQKERSLVKVICHLLGNRGLLVEVRDTGGGFSKPANAPMPAPDAPGGRGLPLMIALADSVEITSSPKGTTVSLKKSSKK